LLAALSGLLLLLTWLLAAATLLTTLLLTWLLLSTAALLTAPLATLAALLTTLARILIWHDAYASFLGEIPAVDNSACASTFRTIAHIFNLCRLELSNKAPIQWKSYDAARGISSSCAQARRNILVLRVSRIAKGSGAVEKPGAGFAKGCLGELAQLSRKVMVGSRRA
jgi:hypothetical protein